MKEQPPTQDAQETVAEYARRLAVAVKELSIARELLRPFAECTSDEIRITWDNVEQEFYNPVPTGHCRRAAEFLEGKHKTETP